MKKRGGEGLTRLRRENAAYWLVRLQAEDLDEHEYEKFKTWLTSNEKNTTEFAAVTHLWNSMDDIESADRIEHLAFATNERKWEQPSSRRRIGTRMVAGLALLCLLPIGFTLLSRDSSQPLTYSTATGENRTVLLEDGSVIHLNTRTTLRWQFDEDIRRVDLIEGEALFDVTPEADRPFVVHAGAGMVRVLGTRFNVHRKNGTDVVVTVLEGRVEVADVDVHISEPNWQRSLTANQKVQYRDAGLASEVTETVAVESVSWRDGVMIIEDQTLVEIVAELNRYSKRRIVILDPSLSDLRAGGVVSVRDIRAALEFFENSGVFRLIETSDSFLLTTTLPTDGGDGEA